MGDRGSPNTARSWKRFGLTLAVGIAVVFFYEMASLVLSLARAEQGREQGAVLAILLMIFATVMTVGVIGGGLAWTIRRRRDATRKNHP